MHALPKAILERQGAPAKILPVTVTQVSPLQVTMLGGTVNGVSIGGGTYAVGAANAIVTAGQPPIILPNAAPAAVNAYTKAQTDALVASPGAISPTSVASSGDVSSSGRVSSNGSPFQSVPSHNYSVTSGYVAAWINSDGQIGTSASTRAVKKDLEDFPTELAAAFLGLTPYLGRYTWDDETVPLSVFLLAEDVAAAGFGPDVVPVDDAGAPRSINYSQLVVPLLAALQAQQTQLDALSTRVTAAGF